MGFVLADYSYEQCMWQRGRHNGTHLRDRTDRAMMRAARLKPLFHLHNRNALMLMVPYILNVL